MRSRANELKTSAAPERFGLPLRHIRGVQMEPNSICGRQYAMVILMVFQIVILGIVTSVIYTPAIAITIDFNNNDSLKGTDDPRFRSFAAKSTFANNYKEDGMIFRDGVVPPDPRLDTGRQTHYHLSYENPLPPNVSPLDPSVNPFQPRVVSPHGSSGAVIQLTFEPAGVPRPFNLTSIDVLSGSLNVGVRDASNKIAVYNNLTAGFTWNLLDAKNLTRATLETTGSIFIIDNIKFDPFGPQTGVPAPAPPQGIKGSIGITDGRSLLFASGEALHESIERAVAPEPSSLTLFATGLLFLGLDFFRRWSKV